MPKHRLATITAILLPLLACAPLASAADARPGETFDVKRPQIREFAREVGERNGIPSTQILQILAQARPQASILEAMDRPAERVLPWWEYRDRFVSDQRIGAGVQFWREHRSELERVAKERGVAPEYLVAILGVETVYGRSTGRYRVLDALTTLSFDYPPRAAYFQRELEQFLLLARDGDVNALKTTGSYAGAMGAPQFMPSSFRAYAVDGSANGKRDLWRDWSDVFASVANYFRAHGWQPERRGGHRCRHRPAARQRSRLAAHLALTETVASLRSKGVAVQRSRCPTTRPAMLIAADEPDQVRFRVGLNNFYVITRYNRSPLYAMAVHDLANRILERVFSDQPLG